MSEAIEPPAHVRIVLSEARKRDFPFEEAWTVAMRSLPRSHPDIEIWREALIWARPSYEAAYYNAPTAADYAPVGSDAESASDSEEAQDDASLVSVWRNERYEPLSDPALAL